MALRVNRIEQIVFPITPPSPPAAGGDVFVQQRPLKNFDSSSTPSTFYREFAAHFADDNVSGVPVGKIVEWRKTNGTTVIASQADNFVYYASGRLRSASFAMLYPTALAASGTDTLKGYAKTGTWNNTSHGTTSLITALDLRAEITISGTTYTFGANNEVANRASTNVQQVRSGPVHAQWRIFGEFRNGTTFNATAEGTVWGVMYLSFFSDGSVQPDCRIFSSKGNVSTAAAKAVTFYQLKDYSGATHVYHSNSSSFTFYAGGFIDCVSTDGAPGYSGTSVDKTVIGFPTPALADPTTTGLYDAKMAWWIKWTPTEVAAMNPAAMSITYTPMTAAEVAGGFVDQGGGSWWIGHMTARAVQAWAMQDYVSFRQDRINALGEGANGYYWFNDAVTGQPYNLSNTSYSGLTQSTSISWGGNTPTITVTGGHTGTGTAESSHGAQWAWYQWLSTGQEKWLDQIAGQVVGLLGCMDAGTGTGQRNAIINGHNYYGVMWRLQCRAWAWGLRNHINTHWALPDSHVLKTYLGDLLTSATGQFANWTDWWTTPFVTSDQLVLGTIVTGEDNSIGVNVNSVNSPWMHDYLATQLAMAVRRGYTTTAHKMIDIHVKLWVYGRGVNGCMYGAPQYNMSIADNTGFSLSGPVSVPPFGNSFATAWSQVSAGNFTDSKASLVTNGTTAAGNATLHFAATTGIVDGQVVLGTNIPDSTTILSHTGTTATMSANATGAGVGSGVLLDFYRWNSTLVNYDATGCPSSGLNSANPYLAGHSYPALFQAAGICGAIVGVSGGSTIETYMATEETAAAVAESTWADLPQHRIRRAA